MARFFCAAIIAIALTSSVAVAEEEHLAWLRFGALQANQTVRLNSADGAYRVRLLDPRSGDARVTHAADGQHFSKPQRVFLVGATAAPQPDDGGFGLVLMGELHEGMCLEWGWGSLALEDRRTTAPLTSIILETPAATVCK